MTYHATPTASVHPSNASGIRPSAVRRADRPAAVKSSSVDPATTIAHRLLSETAHDLQSPLMAVRESLRMVNDGYLGQVNEEQRTALLGALHGCGDMEELLDNMLRLERLRDGMPRVHREWIDWATVTDSVATTIRSAGMDQQVSVRWDGSSAGHHLVYADMDKLRRLLLNLLGNAIRATPEGGQVMVRAEAVRARGTVRCTVIDRGSGMHPEELQQLSERGASASGGAGLGLTISRQMAALHFGELEITSKPAVGTRVGFEIPASGPIAVADRWCRWREQTRRQPSSPQTSRGPADIGRDAAASGITTKNAPLAPSGKVILSHQAAPPQYPDSVAALSLQLSDAAPVDLATEMGKHLQDGLRIYELAYRAAERRWVMLWDADRGEATERITATNLLVAASLPAARLTWSEVMQLPIGAKSTRANIRDLLVRDTLGPDLHTPIGHDRRMTIDHQREQRAAPDLVSRRLDEEVRRLSSRLSRQRELMQQQAAAIRVPPPAQTL